MLLHVSLCIMQEMTEAGGEGGRRDRYMKEGSHTLRHQGSSPPMSPRSYQSATLDPRVHRPPFMGDMGLRGPPDKKHQLTKSVEVSLFMCLLCAEIVFHSVLQQCPECVSCVQTVLIVSKKEFKRPTTISPGPSTGGRSQPATPSGEDKVSSDSLRDSDSERAEH